MFTLTVVCLAFAVIVQCAATVVALLQLGRIRGYRFAWGLVTLALLLMVQRRLEPLEMAMTTGLYDFTAALLAVAISLLLLAGMIGLRLLFRDLEKQRDQLQVLATTDPLTGLFNRREFFARADNEIQRSQRSREPLALFMLDLDLFKRINDRFGHASGDAVLTAVASALQGCLRRIDIVGRIGGEEFAILLPNTGSEAARIAAERLRQAVAELRVGDADIAITTSLGIAFADCVPSDVGSEEFLHCLLQEADTALYVAKGRGRNRVERWTPEMRIQAS